MSVEFAKSETKENLMRAFAGESQARMRYTMAAGEARDQNKYVVAAVFTFTADQEKEHAERYYKLLKEFTGETITVGGTYPVDLSDSLENLLSAAQHNEYEEHDDVYRNFGDKAKEEGFNKIANVFYMIAEVEKTHGDRFGYLAQLIREDKLFVSDVKIGWMCLNCGYIIESASAPQKCPVCEHDQGYFIRLELAPFVGNAVQAEQNQ